MSLGFNPFHLAFDPVVLVAIINLAIQLLVQRNPSQGAERTEGREAKACGGRPCCCCIYYHCV